jgi:hypothetical protein
MNLSTPPIADRHKPDVRRVSARHQRDRPRALVGEGAAQVAFNAAGLGTESSEEGDVDLRWCASTGLNRTSWTFKVQMFGHDE